MNKTIVIITSICFGLFLTNTSLAQSVSEFLVKPYLQFGTQKGMTILWETEEPSRAVFYYTEAQHRADSVEYTDSIVISNQKTLHELSLTDLKIATKYMYKVKAEFEDGTSIVSKHSTFKTNVEDDASFYFVLVGDSQYNSRTPWAWELISELVWKERPNFVVHAGDLVDVGTRKPDWTKHFFPNGHIFMSRFPMYTVLGNHEQDAQLYYDYMANPDPEYYYSFKYGNAEFFMIDTNRDVSEGSEQYDWLEWQLAKSDATWKFVVHHHPPYSSEENDHGDTYLGKSTFGTHARNLVPLYENYDVDFCLFGHTHVYERTWPIYKDKIHREKGVIYINSGGAGGGLEDFDPVRSWFTNELETGHHYCTFAIFENELQFRAIDHDGKLFDYLHFVKEFKDSSTVLQTPVPQFRINKTVFDDNCEVELIAFEDNYSMYYTTDGSKPSNNSTKYTSRFKLDQSSVIKAVAYSEAGRASRIVERSVTKMDPQPAVKNAGPKRGVKYKYYEGEWNYLPDFEVINPVSSGIITTIDIDKIEHRENNFGVVLEGYIEVPETATYTLYTYSDDGSKMYLNGELLIDSDGRHSAKYVYGTTILEKGKHAYRIEYFEGGGNNFIYSGFVSCNNDRVPFSPFVLYY